MAEAVVIDAIRTPIGRRAGLLSSIRPDDLAAAVIKSLVERTKIDSATIDEVIFGAANQAGEDNRNVARMASLLAGLPSSVPGFTVNRLCASGLTAISQASRAICSGEASIIIAGGVESMSRAPLVLERNAEGKSLGDRSLWDTTLGWRMTNPQIESSFGAHALGLTAEHIVDETGIERDRQDAYALESHRRAIAAMDEGRMADEIVSVKIPQRRGEDLVVNQDEHPRRDTTLEQLANLRPIFRPEGTVTAGNSSGLNDGAAALLVMDSNVAKRAGLEPMARICGSASAGVEPRTMGWGPVPATRKLLKRIDWSIEDLDLIELNEAFAAQSIACMDALGLDSLKTNVNGGAIALGHPLGCSGARIVTTLLHEMRRISKTQPVGGSLRGLASLCVGVGQGESMAFETINSS